MARPTVISADMAKRLRGEFKGSSLRAAGAALGVSPNTVKAWRQRQAAHRTRKRQAAREAPLPDLSMPTGSADEAELGERLWSCTSWFHEQLAGVVAGSARPAHVVRVGEFLDKLTLELTARSRAAAVKTGESGPAAAVAAAQRLKTSNSQLLDRIRQALVTGVLPPKPAPEASDEQQTAAPAAESPIVVSMRQRRDALAKTLGELSEQVDAGDRPAADFVVFHLRRASRWDEPRI